MKTVQLILTIVGALLGGALVQWFTQAGQIQAQEKPATVRAKKFELVDEDGEVRAHWQASANTTELEMYGPDMKTSITLRIKQDGASVITFYDAKLKSRIVLGATSDGYSGIAFADKEGRQRAGFGNDKDGAPTLSMMYANGKLASLLCVQGEKDAVLVMNDPTGENMAAFGNSDGHPSMLLIDKAGTERLKLVLKDDNSPAMMLRDEKGRGRLVAGVNTNGWAGIGVMDEKETVRSLLFSDRDGGNGLTVADSKGKSRAAVVVTGKDEPTVELLDDAGKQVFKAPR